MQGSFVLYHAGELRHSAITGPYPNDKSWMQWVLDSMSQEKKESVKAKQLEALKRLGHADLKLNEHERMQCHNNHIKSPLTREQGKWRMK